MKELFNESGRIDQQQSVTFMQSQLTKDEGRLTAGASATPEEKNNEQKQEVGGLDAMTFPSMQGYSMNATMKDGLTALRQRIESGSDSEKGSSSNHIINLQEHSSQENIA